MIRLIIIAAVLTLGLAPAWAGPGFDDWFWGNPIAVLDNDPVTLGIPTEDLYVSGTDGDVLAERMFYARIPSSVIEAWQAQPDEHHGLAIIARGPSYATGHCWANSGTLGHPQARPRVRVGGGWSYADSTAWIKKDEPTFMSVGSADNGQFCTEGGRSVVLMQWLGAPGSDSALSGDVPGAFCTFSLGAPGGVDPHAVFDLYETFSEWDTTYITYDYYPGTPIGPGNPQGDLDYNAVVDDRDLSILLSHWAATDATWGDGDIDGNGRVDDRDLSILLSGWGGDTAVPEPASLAVLGLGGLALRRRR